ncbi:hypothetical protein GCM10011533_30460 [Streptosporangium jomthongense]|uniref:DUF1566 domain-containing protein n=1 Tax=Marinobacter aromaticivorans TaxID=1494078 RepID=A0ABW2IYC2_9GAMM|nr:DUF1566 domain-containing protein [Marinobacter aromaticivorans]GGE75990.1 hypothetical protein GCM10011533_30460 [Streptosporangium jomthongense]
MQITGNATTASGDPADFVRIFSWPDQELVSTAVPAANGDWAAEIAATGDYGITYIAAGCQPITHGPYFIEAGGASDPLPTVIGEAAAGGFYAGDIEDGGKWYKLIVADIEADVYGLKWMDPRGDWPQAESNTDGPGNTLSMAGDARFEAGNHCLDYRGGGFDDWYMPARSELQVIYENLGHNKTPPVGFESGSAQAFSSSDYYWCSTQYSSDSAWRRRFSDGDEGNSYKNSTSRRVRPVRRLEFTP